MIICIDKEPVMTEKGEMNAFDAFEIRKNAMFATGSTPKNNHNGPVSKEDALLGCAGEVAVAAHLFPNVIYPLDSKPDRDDLGIGVEIRTTWIHYRFVWAYPTYTNCGKKFIGEEKTKWNWPYILCLYDPAAKFVNINGWEYGRVIMQEKISTFPGTPPKGHPKYRPVYKLHKDKLRPYNQLEFKNGKLVEKEENDIESFFSKYELPY